MDRTERFQRIIRKLHEKRLVTRAEIQDELEISLATFKRDLEYLRDRLEAPIIWDAEQGGYRFDQPVAAPRYALPGLWFNADEIHALLAMHSLISGMGERVLDSAVAPVLNRVEKLLDGEGNSAAEVKKRIRVISPGHRALEHDDFGQISQAVLQRKRLHIRYYARGAGETSERDVSPQRLVHYRENWYLDAWCHLRKGIRSFAVEEIQSVKTLDQAAKEVPDEELDHALGSSYGIFSGVATQVAKLRFTPERARWVKRETWHPLQKGTFDKQGRYTLELPYSDDRELVMDILRHVPEVEVIAPKPLRDKLLSRLKAYLSENKVISD
ncbi:helix-turn-helix transcriptional regulator [Stenotrophobium rhamnosiphilum]|uniref:Transcriptional regulator n=1 Tax=Stenotrophobium rhamnosiphilum TaxID=2029166 RepID=A0A2T5MI81_9GAMM|nr:YafY family protein [Stenotrophobium rhamnosiphilum]PTU32286.1 transcriptional regulator [Stenotrophobium rhamnosiphilum]